MVIILFLLVILDIFILTFTSNKKFNSSLLKYILIFNVLVISISSMLIIPKPDYDLARHYRDIEILRRTEIDFWEYVFHSDSIVDSNYRFMYTFNAISYIIARFLPKETLTFLSVFSCYGVFGYIMYDLSKEKKMNNGDIALSMLLSNCFLPFLYVYSNIRNEISVAIVALVIYLKIYKRCTIFRLVILCVLAITIHPIGMIAIPFMFLSNIHPGKKGIILVILIPVMLEMIMNVCIKSNYDFLRYIGIKFYNYTFVEKYSQGGFFFVEAVVMLSIVLLLSTLIDRENEEINWQFTNFLSWYCIFSLANIRSYQIIMRQPFIFGILAPAIVNTLFNCKFYIGNKKYIFYLTYVSSILIAIFAVYQNYLWIGG